MSFSHLLLSKKAVDLQIIIEIRLVQIFLGWIDNRLDNRARARPPAAAGCTPDIMGVLRTPQNMIRHHPTIGQVNVLLKLNCDHLRVHLNDGALQPIAYPVSTMVVIAVDLNPIADLVRFFPVWGGCKIQSWQFCLLDQLSNHKHINANSEPSLNRLAKLPTEPTTGKKSINP
jgi:hypothetical protein